MPKWRRQPIITVPRAVPGPGPDPRPAASTERATEAPIERPRPPRGARNLVVVVLDSLRFDSWTAARPKALGRLGEVEKRFSYASWTAPSHYNLLMGLLPHSSPPHVYASEYYKQDFVRYAERLGVEHMEFKELLPSMFLPTYLRNTLGYRTSAYVSMPVLNGHTPINRDFDDYRLMERHNDMAAMLDLLQFEDDRPSFTLLNVGETHYPYAPPHEDPSEWPRISGVHGVFKHLDEQLVGGRLEETEPGFFDDEALAELRARQIRSVTYVDGVVERLYELVPRNTWIVVTADHGELFGEEGYFGHGPVNHEKVYEVPFVEGMVP
ncbi:MAG: sulfatase-like hydrolase/transferase [Acidimicrobiales bacterium]